MLAPELTALAEPQIEHGGLARLPALLDAAGCRRILVISGTSGRHRQRLERALSGLDLHFFSEARRHVPRELVERAQAALEAHGSDCVLSFGGGSTTGLGKALRLVKDFVFVAVPTTYAGSELTDMYGITSAAGKQTGRDERVLPDHVIYDVELTLDMPLLLTVTSLLNALAHPASALSTGQLEEQRWQLAITAARRVEDAIRAALVSPRDAAGRRLAFEGAALAGRVLRRCTLGIHHRLAHALGGRFDLDHAGLHAVLLPHSAAWLAQSSPELNARIEAELGAGLGGRCFDYASSAGAATSLRELGLTEPAFETFLANAPELPRELLRGAFAGSRP